MEDVRRNVNWWAMGVLTRLLLALWVLAVPGRAAAQELVFVDQRGCHYCAMWEAEIGGAYPHTPEGRALPLRRVDLHQPWPSDIAPARRVVLTPTFLIVGADGEEIGRLEGYPGDHLFWPMLGRVIADAGVEIGR